MDEKIEKKQKDKVTPKKNEDGDKVNRSKKQKFLLYKDKPLVRSENILYYGNMSEKCVVMLQILSTKDVGDMKIADKVQVQLMSTDPDLRMKDRIMKKAERKGLYNAMDIGAIWLQRTLTQ